MPQETRWPQRRTGKASEEVMKTIIINNHLASPGLNSLNISSDFIIDSIWPKMNRFDADLLLKGLAFIHSPVKIDES